jgi:diacylglycerol kinase family enzyme
MAIIVNPHSGSAPARGQLCEALRAAALDADVVPLQTTPDAQKWLSRLADGHDVLVAAGGDGTVSTVAAVAERTGKALGVIPAGTLNHFARDTGIPLSLEASLEVIAAGHTRLIDVAVVNDRVFVNNVSIGAYPRLVWERNRARHAGLPRPLATSVALLRTWIDLDTVSVRLTFDDTELVRRTPFVLVGNGEYEVEGTEFGKRPTLSGGTLSLYMAPESGRFTLLMVPVRALLRRLTRHDKFETYTASSIRMDTSESRIRVALDGEIRNLEPPLRFSIRREALRTIVPAGDH